MQAQTPPMAGAVLKEPEFLVVFEGDGGAQTTQMLAGILGLKASAGSRSDELPSLVTFPAARAELSAPVSYEGLGIAAVDLSADEAENLRHSKGIVDVVRNEIRSIPPIPEFHAAFHPTAPVTTAAASTWALAAIGADVSNYAGAGIRVAVLDTGIDLNHPDFRGRVAEHHSFVTGETVQDENGHGTHCCGIVAGPRDPGLGSRYGVAPDAELLVGKVLANNGSGYDSWILSAMAWAADRGARLISMSLGMERQPGAPFNAAYERIASVLLGRGVTVVAAAGNDSKRPHYFAPIGNPAACPSIIAVAAVDQADRVAYFSCGEIQGDHARLSIAAPGVAVHSAWKGSTYRAISGTSMACPHVAGAAALYLEGNPGANPSQIRAMIEAQAKRLQAPRSDVGAGLLQCP